MVLQVTDPQAIGWRDDGSESGVLRVDPVTTGLVMMPFEDGKYAVENTGSSASWVNTIGYNPDGSGTGINVSVPTGSNGVRIWLPFRGPVFGIRYRATPGSADVTVSVDGTPEVVETSRLPNLITAETSYPTDQHGLTVTHRDLDPGDHVAEIVVVSGASTNAVFLYGYVVDRSYIALPQPRSFLLTLGAVPTSLTYIDLGSSAQVQGGMERLIFHNTGGSAATVTLADLSNITFASLSVAAGGHQTFDFGSPISNGERVKQMASAAGVNAFAVTRV